MRLTVVPYLLEFKHPFGVHAFTRTNTLSVMVRIESEGLSGFGEACLPAYLGESQELTLHFLELCRPVLNTCSLKMSLHEVFARIEPLDTKSFAGKAAIDIALNDLYAKSKGISYRQWMGLETGLVRPTSFTIGIDSKEKLVQKIEEAKAFKILKVKIGTADDKGMIGLIRKYTDKEIYVDVNQGWTDKFKALDMLKWLFDQGVLLAEQPMKVDMKKEMKWLTQHSPIPTIADESVKGIQELKEMDGAFSGVNIKLMKSAGMTQALEMIHYAKKNKIKIMLGCMAESSCATTAMAQFMQYADYIDLDAPNLYANDPFKGLEYKNGDIHLNPEKGIGVSPEPGLFPEGDKL